MNSQKIRVKLKAYDHRLLEVVDSAMLASLKDFQDLLPETMSRPFTNKDLAGALGCHISLAQKMTYTLRRVGAVTQVGKRGHAYLYM